MAKTAVEQQIEQLRKDLQVVTNNQKQLYSKIEESIQHSKAVEKNSDYLISTVQTMMGVYNENKGEIGDVIKKLSQVVEGNSSVTPIIEE